MVQSVMPTSLLPRNNMNGGPAHIDDQRAYQLALELSMLGLGNGNVSSNNNQQQQHHHLQSMSSHHHYNNFEDYRDENNEHMHAEPFFQPENHFSSHGNPLIEPPFDESIYGNNSRKSANMTETVPVPSSEHVAEIVGRQGKASGSLIIEFMGSWTYYIFMEWRAGR